MGYRIDPMADNCYPGTAILINKFDIRDEAKLNEVETVLVSARSAEWITAPAANTFDFAHYKAIHQFLFSDLYDWAGQIRTVNISKKGTIFCPAENIERQASLTFRWLKEQNYLKGLPRNEFIEEFIDFYCSTNYLHPFREGNGRTQRVFLTQLVRNAEYDLNWSEVDGELLMIATIQSAQGVPDLLRQVLGKSIK